MHFDQADARNREAEDRRFTAQREWEGELEKRHHDAQLNLMRQMMQQTSTMMMGFFDMMSKFGQQPPVHQPTLHHPTPHQATPRQPTPRQPTPQQPSQTNAASTSATTFFGSPAPANISSTTAISSISGDTWSLPGSSTNEFLGQ